MEKTLKISNYTHSRLQAIGNIGDTFEDAIKRLLDNYADLENVILQVKIVGNDKREVHLKNPLYYWTDQNYDAFLKIAFEMYGGEWKENILKKIAQNPEWYEVVQRYKSEGVK